MPLLFSPPIGADGSYREASAQEITAQLLRVQVESLKQYIQTMEAQLALLESQLPPQENESNDVSHSNDILMQTEATSNDHDDPPTTTSKEKRI